MSETTQSIPVLQRRPEVVDSAAPSGWTLGGRYQVVDRLGSGGMADVFRAYDSILGRAVAVKVFRASAARAAHDVAHERREAEVRALAALNHPNLVTLFDASLSDSPPFLVLELIDGPALSDRLVTGPLSAADVCSVGSQIADALAYVHAHDMVHRDVKPANILLGVDGTDPSMTWRARLSDFGIVRMVGSAHLTSAELTVGSASYLAPEQARGGEVDPAADVYSLGLVLIEALSGQRCFDGSPMEALAARLATSPQIPATATPQMAGLLRAMTAMDPAARPSAAAVARQLREPGWGITDPGSLTMQLGLPGAAAAGAALAAVPAADVDGDVREPGRRTHRALLAAILLSIIGAGIVLILNSGLSTAGTKGLSPAGDGTSIAPSVSSHQAQRVGRATAAAAVVQRGSAHATATGSAPSTAAANSPRPVHSAKAPVPPPAAGQGGTPTSTPTVTPTPTPTPTGSAPAPTSPAGTASAGAASTSPGGVIPS